MKILKFTVKLAVALLITTAHGHLTYAQTGIDPDRLTRLQTQLTQASKVLNSLPDTQKKTLSSGAQNLRTLAQGWNRVEEGMGRAALRGRQAQSWVEATQDIQPDAFGSRVSNPARDFLFSISGGFTQSETSTAWCGNNVVVGFNNSGSLLASLLFGAGGLSFSGASFSTNSGVSFQEIGFMNAGSNPGNFLLGDPVVTCTAPRVGGQIPSAPTYYYSQLFEIGSVNSAPLTAIALSRSTNGGATWEDPVAAVQKDALTHFLDKDWSAADPANPGNLFITYTDFDTSGSVCGVNSAGIPIERVAIELVRSTDGGATWSSPVALVEPCVAAPNFSFVQGSQVLVDASGAVYVAWESIGGAAGTSRALWIRRSADHGASFGPAVKIDNVVGTGDSATLQANFRNNEFPLMAADRNSGTLYVTWNDGRNFALPDLEAPDGVYHYADILVSRSTNGGATWSSPVRVNSDPLTHLYNGQSIGTDHFMPGIAVDNTGTVGLCWYDRRADPANLGINRFCATSTDGGVTWPLRAVTTSNWRPWHNTDAFIAPTYLGDYDSVTSDFTMSRSGFLGAYGFVNANARVPNQDVGIISFP